LRLSGQTLRAVRFHDIGEEYESNQFLVIPEPLRERGYEFRDEFFN
jgi:hypothetical protein